MTLIPKTTLNIFDGVAYLGHRNIYF
ncbi:hypothetical protein HOE425_331561 [Hoeflea sp. EC-HK425]|nr:hypothetical protein HOE425_331561 [Hoeflea sp. EC-HK425]